MRRLALLAVACALAPPAPAVAAPRAEAWERWRSSDARHAGVIDHAPWATFLERYTLAGSDGIGRVRYGSVSAGDRRALDAYLARLAATKVRSFRRDEQLAYWINLYNALTVDVVLDHHPVASIRDISISPGLFASGPWGKKLVEIEREPVSLDDIEHRILRPLWRDPRIHYALNCASLGCPNLAREAFSAESTERLLETGARTYVNHPRGVSFENGELTVSSIYVWFAEDFGGERGVLAHLRRYAGPELAARLALSEEITDHAYDWSLNDAETGAGH